MQMTAHPRPVMALADWARYATNASAVANAQRAADRDVIALGARSRPVGERCEKARAHPPVGRHLRCIHGSRWKVCSVEERAGGRRNRSRGRALDLRSLDPARQSADRRIALAIGYGAIGSITLAVVAVGGGGRALATSVIVGLGGLPWVFAFGGRWRLLDDAVAGVPFAGAATGPACGDRAGRAERCSRSGSPSALGWPARSRSSRPGRRGGYTALVSFAEARYERLILLDLRCSSSASNGSCDTRESRRAPLLERRDAASGVAWRGGGNLPYQPNELRPGSAFAPRTVTSKCRCGPVAKP